MTREDTICDTCKNPIFSTCCSGLLNEPVNYCPSCGRPLTEEACADLEAQDRSNDPLTLEELRGMDGEPVWCAFPDGCGRYMIIQWNNSEFFKSYECGFLLAEEYGKSWLAYRRKPEESISDTLIDLANYSVMGIMEMELEEQDNEDCQGKL